MTVAIVAQSWSPPWVVTNRAADTLLAAAAPQLSAAAAGGKKGVRKRRVGRHTFFIPLPLLQESTTALNNLIIYPSPADQVRLHHLLLDRFPWDHIFPLAAKLKPKLSFLSYVITPLLWFPLHQLKQRCLLNVLTFIRLTCMLAVEHTPSFCACSPVFTGSLTTKINFFFNLNIYWIKSLMWKELSVVQ